MPEEDTPEVEPVIEPVADPEPVVAEVPKKGKRPRKEDALSNIRETDKTVDWSKYPENG